MYTSDELLKEVNNYISNLNLNQRSSDLFKPIEYLLSLGGKRIRPSFLLMAYNLYQKDISKVLPVAIGLEIYHNSTLMHDDLMDASDQRRGKKTVHKIWNDNTAVLSGDGMILMAYEYVAQAEQTHLKEVVSIFTQMAIDICKGQQLDLSFESQSFGEISIADYFEMIRLKTAVFFAAAFKIGAILGGASPKDAELLYDFGIEIGLSFQLQDDYLDVFADEKVFGKQLYNDIRHLKKTYMILKTYELMPKADQEMLSTVLNESTEEERVERVLKLYNKLNIAQLCEVEIEHHYQQAMNKLEELSVQVDKKEIIIKFVKRMMNRKS